MSDVIDTARLWRVVTDDGTVHDVDVYRDLGGWFTSATGSLGLATPHAAAQTHAEECHWCVAEILAPGQRSRAEVERERDALRAVVAALPRCVKCSAPATQENADYNDRIRCDDHVPTGWEVNDLPYAAALREWKGMR